MKQIYTYIVILFLMVALLGMYSHYAIKKDAFVFYIPQIPGSLNAFTLPPLGIYIEKSYQQEGSVPDSIIEHEQIHWLQYQEKGLWKYYFDYVRGI